MKGSHTTNTFRQTECQTTNHLVTYHQKEPFDMQGNASSYFALTPHLKGKNCQIIPHGILNIFLTLGTCLDCAQAKILFLAVWPSLKIHIK